VLTEDQIWEILDTVKDPEIPVVSVVEMGVVRKVEMEGSRARITLTPTFSGCPALDMMKTEIQTRLEANGMQVSVIYTNKPPWSSDWISPEAREKLKQFGLAPPPRHDGRIEAALLDVVACPYCGSQDTVLKNSFGPTLCRAIYVCSSCKQPFEQFKPL
jgi:ring-1,2-phenylacetyl-CoA epoxidase subunit PaaD